MAEPEAPVRSRLTSRSTTFALLLVGGLLAEVSTAQPWWRASGGGARVAFTGTESTGGLSQALAVVCLAGTLLVLVLRARGRRVLAVLLALSGLGVVLVGVLRLRPTGDAVRTKLAEVSLISQYAVSPTLWPWVSALAGLVLTGGAAALLVGAPRWPSSAARFDRTAAAGPADTDDPATIWKAQDAGLDPTAGVEERFPPVADDPDVHIGGARDTMVAHSSTVRPRPAQTDRDRGRSRSGRAEGSPTDSSLHAVAGMRERMAEAAQSQSTQSQPTQRQSSDAGASRSAQTSSQSSSDATQASSTAHQQSRGGHGGKHVHHGRTPAAWAGVVLALIGFILGGYAVLVQNWTVFWIAAAVCVVALIVAGVMQKMGYGAD